MKTLLNLSAVLFCAMLVSCNHKQEVKKVENSPDERIQSADNSGTDVGNSSAQIIDMPSDPPK